MYNQLDNINTPHDLKALDLPALEELCAEIRQEMIDVVSANGGHLASNLGVVELTVALHKVFDCPSDAILFDVGHQCYTHKLLTGRRNQFATLRKKGGLSGFPRPSESEYDPFIAGHSSTSLSDAIGLVRAKQLRGDNSKTIVILGDGAFANGMVYEAINNIDSSMQNLIVILNDNTMSISKSVGSISRYLMHLRTNASYSRFKKAVSRFLGKLPLVGKWIASTLLKWKSTFRRLLYGGTLLEELGFNYVGPVDGHDLDELCRLLTNVKQLEGPVLVHALTVKGKGFAFAEENPGAYHGVEKFDVEIGNPDISFADSFSNVFGKKLCDLADYDPQICGVTAAMKYATGMHYLSKQHRERFFDVGIAEEHAVAFCAGLARGGMKPVFSVYSTFLQRAFDQLLQEIVLSEIPVTLAIDRAGFVGTDGETHQGLLDVAMLESIGTFAVASPSNYAELQYWTEKMIQLPTPSAVRYPRGAEDERLAEYACTGEPYDLLQMGTESRHLFITYGRVFAEVLEAAQILNTHGVACDILKLNQILPLDATAVALAAKYDAIVFVEEGVIVGGLGEHMLSALNASGFVGQFQIQGVRNPYIAQASVTEQLAMSELDSDTLVKLFLEEPLENAR